MWCFPTPSFNCGQNLRTRKCSTMRPRHVAFEGRGNGLSSKLFFPQQPVSLNTDITVENLKLTGMEHARSKLHAGVFLMVPIFDSFDHSDLTVDGRFGFCCRLMKPTKINAASGDRENGKDHFMKRQSASMVQRF